MDEPVPKEEPVVVLVQVYTSIRASPSASDATAEQVKVSVVLGMAGDIARDEITGGALETTIEASKYVPDVYPSDGVARTFQMSPRLVSVDANVEAVLECKIPFKYHWC